MEIDDSLNPSAERLAEEVARHREGYLEGFGRRAADSLGAQVFANATLFFWRSLGLMLIGAGLMKLGVFTAARSYGYYTGMIAVGYGIGLPLSALSVWWSLASDFDIAISPPLEAA